MYLKRTVAPAGKILTVEDVRRQLRITFTDEDAYLAELIDEVTEFLEGIGGRGGYLARALLTQQFEYRIDDFPRAEPLHRRRVSRGLAIDLPMPPLQSVESVKYLDGAGTLQTMDAADYTVETETLQGRIVLPRGGSWPSDVASQPNAVRIAYTAGYGATAEAVPATIRKAAKMLAGMYYQTREAGGAENKAGFGFATSALLDNLRETGF